MKRYFNNINEIQDYLLKLIENNIKIVIESSSIFYIPSSEFKKLLIRAKLHSTDDEVNISCPYFGLIVVKEAKPYMDTELFSIIDNYNKEKND